MQQPVINKDVKTITLQFVIAILLFTTLLIVFYLIADEIVIEHEGNFDTYIFNFLARYKSDALTSVLLVFTFFGSTNFIFPAYFLLTAYYLFIRKNKKLALDVATIGLTGTVLLFSLKDIFKRSRPLDPLIHASGYSFPSGHSYSAFTFFGLMIYLLFKTKLPQWAKLVISIVLFLLAFVVAISRVYLHVHFASDVAGGICLSIMWLLLALWVLHKIDVRYFRKKLV